MAATVRSDFEPLTGHCTCKAINYTLLAPPLIVHCCHCTYCQRETGSAFVINVCIEASNVLVSSSTKTPTQPTLVKTPAASGVPQVIARCPNCWVALYSHYDNNKWVSFVRGGTLSEGSRQRVKPDVHIFTGTKAEWVDLRKEIERGAKLFEDYYVREEVWSKDALERRERLLKEVEQLEEEELERIAQKVGCVDMGSN